MDGAAQRGRSARCWHFLLTGLTWPNSSPIPYAQQKILKVHEPNPKQKLGKKEKENKKKTYFKWIFGEKRLEEKRSKKKKKSQNAIKINAGRIDAAISNAGTEWVGEVEKMLGGRNTKKKCVCPSSKLSFFLHIFMCVCFLLTLHYFLSDMFFVVLYSNGRQNFRMSSSHYIKGTIRFHSTASLVAYRRDEITVPFAPLLMCTLVFCRSSLISIWHNRQLRWLLLWLMFNFEWFPNDFLWFFSLMSDPNSSPKSNVGPALLMHSKISRWKWKCCV